MTTDPQASRDLRTFERALQGDDEARRELSERLTVVRAIVSTLNARAGRPLSHHEVEDVCQDVQQLVLQKLRLFQGFGTLEAWLYRFCTFVFRNRCRREALRARHVEALPTEPESPGAEPGDEIDADELRAALTALGPPSEEVIRLKHESGESFEEIAQRLGLPTSTVKTRYYEGIRWLRERLSRGRGARP